jgi:hypothetical protein
MGCKGAKLVKDSCLFSRYIQEVYIDDHYIKHKNWMMVMERFSSRCCTQIAAHPEGVEPPTC